MKQITFSLLDKPHTLESTDTGYLVDGDKLEYVMKRNDEFSIAFRAFLLVKGLQALMNNS